MGAGRSEARRDRVRPAPRAARRAPARQELTIRKYSDALREGIAYLSEDRKAAGVYLDLPIAQNIASMALQRVSSALRPAARAAEHGAWPIELGAKLKLEIGRRRHRRGGGLSGRQPAEGGHRQAAGHRPCRAADGRAHARVDVGAKSEIHHILREPRQPGRGRGRDLFGAARDHRPVRPRAGDPRRPAGRRTATATT